MVGNSPKIGAKRGDFAARVVNDTANKIFASKFLERFDPIEVGHVDRFSPFDLDREHAAVGLFQDKINFFAIAGSEVIQISWSVGITKLF